MADAIALTKQGGDEVVAYACSSCSYVVGSVKSHGSIAIAKEEADRCCTCRTCGKGVPRLRSACDECRTTERQSDARERDDRERARFVKATKLSTEEYAGMAYDPTERLGRDGYFDIDDLEEELLRLDPEERPTFVWACSKQPITVDVHSVVESITEHACEDHHEDALEQLVGVDDLEEQLRPLLDAWVAKQTTYSYEADYSTALVISPIDESALEEAAHG